MHQEKLGTIKGIILVCRKTLFFVMRTMLKCPCRGMEDITQTITRVKGSSICTLFITRFLPTFPNHL